MSCICIAVRGDQIAFPLSPGVGPGCCVTINASFVGQRLRTNYGGMVAYRRVGPTIFGRIVLLITHGLTQPQSQWVLLSATQLTPAGT